MVRAHMKQASEDKKDGHKKKSAQKKKAQESCVWPCKINGCNKQFAREADLKRHQRTTKLHSVPGFRCPQCESTFTRTDALRRHQKSRHNGVVIEPEPPEEDDDTSKSGSRGGTPGGSNSGPGGSYYRPHTLTAGLPPGSPVIMESRYNPPIGLPTSATRGNWQTPPPPWTPEGRPPQMGAPASNQPAPAVPCQTSPYYRPGTGGASDMAAPPSQPVPANGEVPVQDSNQDVEMKDGTPQSSPLVPAPVIDPSLDGNQAIAAGSQAPIPIDLNHPAVRALLESAQKGLLSISGRINSSAQGGAANAGGQEGQSSTGRGQASEGGGGNGGSAELKSGSPEKQQQQPPQSEPPPPAPSGSEQVVTTEEGVPMLNPGMAAPPTSTSAPSET